MNMMRILVWVIAAFWTAGSIVVVLNISTVNGDAGRFTFLATTIALGLAAIVEGLHTISKKLSRSAEEEQADAVPARDFA